MARMTKLEAKRSSAATKAWATRRALAKKANRTVNHNSLVAAMRPGTTPSPVRSTASSTQPTGANFTKGLRKRTITAKTVVEKVKNSRRMEYYGGTDRSVLVLYTK